MINKTKLEFDGTGIKFSAKETFEIDTIDIEKKRVTVRQLSSNSLFTLEVGQSITLVASGHVRLEADD